MASDDSDYASASMVASDGEDSGSNGTEEWQILSGLEFSSNCEGQIIERGHNHTRKEKARRIPGKRDWG